MLVTTATVTYCTIHLSPNPGRTVDVPDFDEIPKNRKKGAYEVREVGVWFVSGVGARVRVRVRMRRYF